MEVATDEERLARMTQTENVPRLLVVEDHPELAKLLAVYLGRHGYDVTVAFGLEEAGAALAKGPAFAAIVTDFGLPESGGVEVLQEASRLCPGALRVLMSGGLEATSVNRLPEGLVHHFFEKPLDLVRLREALEKAR